MFCSWASFMIKGLCPSVNEWWLCHSCAANLYARVCSKWRIDLYYYATEEHIFPTKWTWKIVSSLQYLHSRWELLVIQHTVISLVTSSVTLISPSMSFVDFRPGKSMTKSLFCRLLKHLLRVDSSRSHRVNRLLHVLEGRCSSHKYGNDRKQR